MSQHAEREVQLARGAWLVERDGGLVVVEENRESRVDENMVVAVFERYARPLAVAAPAREPDDQVVTMTHPTGRPAVVRAFAFKGFGDVIPSDYLLLEIEGAEPVAAPARLAGAALIALARAWAAKR